MDPPRMQELSSMGQRERDAYISMAGFSPITEADADRNLRHDPNGEGLCAHGIHQVCTTTLSQGGRFINPPALGSPTTALWVT
jgi:hypothetical protein